MNSYNKATLDRIAKEQGFIRDNLEKVMRLVEILGYFSESTLLSKTLALKGGTAINLTVFDLPRLSVDIDLDFSVDCDRQTMLDYRENINDEILRYMTVEGYRIAPSSRNPHTLDSWVFFYTNAAGNNDNIKIEINYSDRCHVLPIVDKNVSIPLLSDVKVRTLSPIELFASKINALIGRGATRDVYDVHNMIAHKVFALDEELNLLRKVLVFYMTVGNSSNKGAIPTTFDEFPMIDKIRFSQIRSQLLPVLRHSEHFDLEMIKAEVRDFLLNLLHLSEKEKLFIEEFNARSYKPQLLFDDKEMVERVVAHPMALWKMGIR